MRFYFFLICGAHLARSMIENTCLEGLNQIFRKLLYCGLKECIKAVLFLRIRPTKFTRVRCARVKTWRELRCGWAGGREREWKALPPRWRQFMVWLLLWGSAQGAGVATAASKMARRCSTSAARCAMNRRVSSGDTLVSHRGGRTCGLPTSRGRLVTNSSSP